ncbi:hypothetical protein GGI35DRAFT_299637 [Trichoderma velutinum]
MIPLTKIDAVLCLRVIASYFCDVCICLLCCFFLYICYFLSPQLFLTFPHVFPLSMKKPDFAHSGNRNSRHQEFALVIKRFAIIKVLLISFFLMYFCILFSHVSHLLLSYLHSSSSFCALVGFLFQSLPFVSLLRWTWGNGGCPIITGVSLSVSSPDIYFPVYLHHSLGDLEFFLVPMHGVLIRL